MLQPWPGPFVSLDVLGRRADGPRYHDIASLVLTLLSAPRGPLATKKRANPTQWLRPKLYNLGGFEAGKAFLVVRKEFGTPP